MVRPLRSAALALLALGTLALGQQAARAAVDPGPASGSNYGNAGTHSSGTGYGTPAHNTSGTCSLYANASSFGAACLTGGGGGQAKTVAKILGDGYKSLLPICWDERITEADWQQNYSADGSAYPADTPEYTDTCLLNIDPAKTIADQTGLQITQLTVGIPYGQPCGEPPLKGQAAADAVAHRCVQVLTATQQQVVGGFDSQLNGEIPRPSITTFPSPGQVRTQVPTAFIDTGEPAKDKDGNIRTPSVNADGTIMYAQMDQSTFSIDPGDGTGPITCSDPFTSVGEDATPENTPQSCWHAYHKDSFGQPGRVYSFTAQVKWTVYANGKPLTDRGDGHTATFTEIDTVKLEVDDVQTIVVGNNFMSVPVG